MDLLSFQETQQESYSTRGPTSSKTNIEDGVSHERPSSLPVSDGSASQSASRVPLRPAAGDFRAYVCVLTGVISSCGHSHVRPHAQKNIRTGTDSLANPRTRADPASHACGNCEQVEWGRSGGMRPGRSVREWAAPGFWRNESTLAAPQHFQEKNK